MSNRRTIKEILDQFFEHRVFEDSNERIRTMGRGECPLQVASSWSRQNCDSR